MVKINFIDNINVQFQMMDGSTCIISLKPQETIEKNQLLLDEALDIAYYERKNTSKKYTIVYMKNVKFVYWVNGICAYCSEIPENLQKIKEWLR